MDESDARSLAGVFVDLVRQQHEQRALLVRRGAQQLWKECDQLTDCCCCKRLSYITVALDNEISSVRVPPARDLLQGHSALAAYTSDVACV